MIERPAVNPQVACVLERAECRETPPLLRSGWYHMLAKQAVLAEPSEPTTARRAAPITPASRASSRSPGRPIRARGAKRSTGRLAMCVVATTANPTRGAHAARARRIPRSRGARQEFANLPNPKHISLDCHRGGVGCEGLPRPVAEVVTVVVRALLAVETPRKRGGVFRTQRRAPRTHVCTTTARTPRAKERLA